MATITLKGREIPLIYTTQEMLTIQQEIAPYDRMIQAILGKDPADENNTQIYLSAEHLANVAKAVRILGNAGLEEAGEKPDLTDKFVLRVLPPPDVQIAINRCMEAIAIGMKSEIPPKEEDGPVDVTLEEMNKKKEADS